MTYLIKFGGGLITDKSKPLHARRSAIKRIAEELADNWRSQPEAQWIIGTGAGSYGHYMVQACDYLSNPSDPKRIAVVHQSVETLCQLVVDALVESGVPACLVSPLQLAEKTDDGITLDFKPIKKLLNAGLVPVVHGDIVMDGLGSSSILSTEPLLHAISQKISGKRLTIYATAVDGILDKAGKTIPVFSKSMKLHSHPNHDFDVTGGMGQKVAAGLEALKHSKAVYIINGNQPGALTAALNMQVIGTRLKP